MLRSCDVENCEDTPSIMVESRRKDKRIARPECQMMLSTRYQDMLSTFFEIFLQSKLVCTYDELNIYAKELRVIGTSKAQSILF